MNSASFNTAAGRLDIICSGEVVRVQVSPSETQLVKHGKSERDALIQLAFEFDRMRDTVQCLVEALTKANMIAP